MYSQEHSHCPSLPAMSSWPSCWVYWERRGRNIQETEPAHLLCSREVRRRKPRSWKEACKEEEINSSKLSVSLIVETYGANPRPICARYTRGERLYIREICVLFSTPVQCVSICEEEQQATLSRPISQHNGLGEKVIRAATRRNLPPKAEDGMRCLGKWCFSSKEIQVRLEVAAFQWLVSHWNYVLHRHPQVY